MPFPTPILRSGPYKSQYGPKYHYQPNVMGQTTKQLYGLGLRAGAFGGVALAVVIFFASGIPRVQQDILQKVPVAGNLFVKEPKPASDNPF